MPTYTGTQFKTLIANHLNRSDLTTTIPDFCALAAESLDKEGLWFQFAATTINTVAHTGYVSLPTDFVKEIEKEVGETLRGPTVGYSLTKMGYPDLDYFQKAGYTEDQPYYFAIVDKIYLYPIPDQVYALTFAYYKSLGFPADGASNAWTVAAWDITFENVMEEAWRYLGNDSEMMKAAARKNKKLGKLKNISGLRQATGKIRATRF
jgi:hypothetical protein